jgi:hypothetical protein
MAHTISYTNLKITKELLADLEETKYSLSEY